METGLGDFLGQIPITFILAPIFFGILYIISMVIVFRRAAERRRKRREAQQIGTGLSYPHQNALFTPAMAGSLASGSAVPTMISSRTVMMSAVPPVEEPDLDLLTTNSLLDDAERMSAPASQAEPAESSAGAAVPSAESAAPLPLVTLPDAVPGDAVEVMRIWRDMNDGGLIVQMGNQRYRSLAEVHTPDLQRRFTAVVRDLMSLAGIANTTTATAPRATSTFAPASITPLPPAASKPAGVLDRVARRGSSQKQEEPPAGIAASVEEFLQLRLIASPLFAAREIHVRPSGDHGIKIEVDHQFYDSVDEVADSDVREFLQTVMAEWTARQ